MITHRPLIHFLMIVAMVSSGVNAGEDGADVSVPDTQVARGAPTIWLAASAAVAIIGGAAGLIAMGVQPKNWQCSGSGHISYCNSTAIVNSTTTTITYDCSDISGAQEGVYCLTGDNQVVGKASWSMDNGIIIGAIISGVFMGTGLLITGGIYLNDYISART